MMPMFLPLLSFVLFKKSGFDSFPEFRFYIKTHLEKVHYEEHQKQLSLEERIRGLNMTIFHPDVEIPNQEDGANTARCGLYFIYGDGGVWRQLPVCRPQARKYRLLLHQHR